MEITGFVLNSAKSMGRKYRMEEEEMSGTHSNS